MSKHSDSDTRLISFLQASPTPYHAVANMGRKLQDAGFQRLDETCAWQLAPGQNYYVTRNDSSLIAFKTGSGDLVSKGVRLAGAHTDSPCLKIKPNPEILKNNYLQLGVEVYGGVLLNPWYDRDLSIAGRVNYIDADGQLSWTLIDFVKPVAVIPSLAIHLDKDVNQNRSINPQTDIPPVLMQVENGQDVNFRELLARQIEAGQGEGSVSKVLDYELCFYDVQAPAVIGLKQEFLASARLDNLLSCFVGIQSLLAAGDEQAALLMCSDHEEVGSVSSAGANGPFLEAVLERMAEQLGADGGRGKENLRRMLGNSWMISMDNAHGVHPNYADRHDQQHGPILNRGPVIKINANQRYATSSENSARFRHLCEAEDVAVQSFVVRTDMGCGSTIGPIVAGQLGISTLDVGVPTWGMHSIRELAGVQDSVMLGRVMTRFFNG